MEPSAVSLKNRMIMAKVESLTELFSESFNIDEELIKELKKASRESLSKDWESLINVGIFLEEEAPEAALAIANIMEAFNVIVAAATKHNIEKARLFKKVKEGFKTVLS